MTTTTTTTTATGCPDCTWRRDCPAHREQVDWAAMTERIAARRAARQTAPPPATTTWGFTLSDIADHGWDEPENRMLWIGWGFPTRRAAMAEAGRIIVELRYRADRVALEISGDQIGPGFGWDDLAEARKAFRAGGNQGAGWVESGSHGGPQKVNENGSAPAR